VRSEGFTSYTPEKAYKKFGLAPKENSEVLALAYLILQQFKLNLFEKGF
jgi:hypothetical protein